jgi:hypothetical protein
MSSEQAFGETAIIWTVPCSGSALSDAMVSETREQVVIQPLGVKKSCPRNAERPLLEGGHDATFIYHTFSYKPGIKRELSLPRQAKCCLQIWSHSNPQEAGTYLPAGGDFAFTVNLVERRVTCYDPRYSW